MKPSSLLESVVMALMVAGAADAAATTLCLETRTLVSQFVVERAKMLTSRIFEEVGTPVRWAARQACKEAGVIRIRIEGDAPRNVSPEAMALALPYADGGDTIRVFYNRVVSGSPKSSSELLGHVMAHEITHVLQGVARHSQTGLMKAHWGVREYAIMRKHLLPVAPEDVELLQVGLSKRANRILTDAKQGGVI